MTQAERESGRALRYAREAGRMMALPTVYEEGRPLPPAFAELHRLFEELFPHLYAGSEAVDLEGSLLFKIAGSDPAGGLPLALMSHQDVVAAPGEWTHPPFGGEVADGRLWGRGALDIKANLYCILRAADELLEQGFVPRRDVYLISSCMEEVGGNDLAADWLEARGVKLGLLLDEGSPVMADPYPGVHGDWAAISLAEKGMANIRFTARGAGGHPMMLHRNSPLVRLGRLMTDCEDRPPFPFEPGPVVRAMLERIDAMLPEEERTGSEWSDEKLERVLGPIEAGMVRTTMVFTQAKGSDTLASVPIEAWVSANLRLAPPLTPADALAALAERAEAQGVEAALESGRDPSPAADLGSRGFAAVEAAVRATMPGVVPLPYVLSGGTDTKHFHKVCGCCLRFTPIRVDRSQQFAVHGVDENIDVSALPGAVDFFKELIARWE